MTQRNGLLWSLLWAAVAGLLLLRADGRAQENLAASGDRRSAQDKPEITRDNSGVVSIKIGRVAKINVGNRTTGPIVVIGWDRDFIEATATSDRGTEGVRVKVDSDTSGTRVALKADYAESVGLRHGVEIERPAPPESLPPVKADIPDRPTPPITFFDGRGLNLRFRPGEIFLEVKVPRHTELELIEVVRSNVIVSGLETAVVVSGEKSTIKLSRVGAAEVKTRSGDVEVDEASGLVDVITTSGAIVVRKAAGDVRALSLSGRIEVQCARGRVDVSNTDGPITLAGVSGDTTAVATNSQVHFSGAIRADGRYFLKSMSGAVEMQLPANSPGFTATLSSYRGGIETEFDLKTKQSTPNSPANRRLIGRYGNGQAQITLDSFDGQVRLSKLATPLKDCR
jgi:hypothetical protein